MESANSVDLISDLNLSKTEQFDWTGKPTSLFCVVAGNISDDLSKARETLEHLGSMYRGVFYIDGHLEQSNINGCGETIGYLDHICKKIPNVIYMHNHVVMINSIAFVAVNGWYGKYSYANNTRDRIRINRYQNEDLAYLSNSIRDLQLHKDATKIVVVSNSIPSEYMLYGKKVDTALVGFEPGIALSMDTEKKITHWLYGNTDIVGDIVYNGRRYANNPRLSGQPYWPKRIII